MQKPNSYEATQAPGEFNPIKPGGYACKIMQVVEKKSKSGLDMLVISIDVADGTFKDYYAKMYKSSTKPDKKWGGTMYLVVDESTEYGTKNLKGFVTSVEKSNQGFQVVWGDAFCKSLQGKKVGVLFRKEQYVNQMNEVKWITKPFQFRSVEGALAADVPADKPLSDDATDRWSDSQQPTGNQGFMNIPDGIDEELPFM